MHINPKKNFAKGFIKNAGEDMEFDFVINNWNISHWAQY